MSFQEPVDELHRQCLWELAEIRRQFSLARYRVALWRPQPPPERKTRP